MCVSQLQVQSSVVDTRTFTCVNGYYRVFHQLMDSASKNSFAFLDVCIEHYPAKIDFVVKLSFKQESMSLVALKCTDQHP